MKKLLILLTLILTSCGEKIKIVELQGIIVDTTYIYKVERTDKESGYYDIIHSKKLFKGGDYTIYYF